MVDEAKPTTTEVLIEEPAEEWWNTPQPGQSREHWPPPEKPSEEQQVARVMSKAQIGPSKGGIKARGRSRAHRPSDGQSTDVMSRDLMRCKDVKCGALKWPREFAEHMSYAHKVTCRSKEEAASYFEPPRTTDKQSKENWKDE